LKVSYSKCLSLQISDKSSGKEFQMERDLKSLKCLIPEADWIEILTNILNSKNISFDDFSKTEAIFDMYYLIRVSILLKNTDPTIIANYLGWRVVETFGFLMGGNQFLGINYHMIDLLPTQ